MSLYLVEAPKVAPATGGLLPLANVITTEADRVAFHGPTHEAVLSGHTRTVPTDGSDKVFDQVVFIDGVTFASYRGIDSALLLGVDGEPIARDQFEAGESYAVEQAVQKLLLNPKAVDITPTAGTPVTNVKAALGLLEQYMADNYTGLPLLHGNRFAVSLPLELVREGGKLSTINGSPIANGGGYSKVGPARILAPAVTLGATATSGGTFAAGDYSWVVTAINGAGETLASNVVTKTLAVNGTQVLNWGGVTGSTGFKVWRTSGGVTSLVATLANVTTYTDTGTVGTVASPPAVNTTGTAAAGTAWLYVSGQVNVWRGKLNVLSGPAQYNNRDFALAETPYAATIDGPVAAILVGF